MFSRESASTRPTLSQFWSYEIRGNHDHHKIRRSPDFEALKFGKGRSGTAALRYFSFFQKLLSFRPFLLLSFLLLFGNFCFTPKTFFFSPRLGFLQLHGQPLLLYCFYCSWFPPTRLRTDLRMQVSALLMQIDLPSGRLNVEPKASIDSSGIDIRPSRCEAINSMSITNRTYVSLSNSKFGDSLLRIPPILACCESAKGYSQFQNQD